MSGVFELFAKLVRTRAMLQCEPLRNVAAFAYSRSNVTERRLPGVSWNWACFPTRRSIRASIGRRCCRRCFPDCPISPASGRSLPRRSPGSGAASGAEARSQVKDCDALFWIQLAARPISAIHVASYLNLRARRSNFVLDAWKPSLTKIGLVATVERLDPCFVAYREAMDELKRRFPLAKFVWLPFGAHTDIFYPRKEEKSVFAFWMGRRYEPLHQALLAYCEARGLSYVYSKDGGLTTEELGRLTSSAQYFVVTPPDLDNPKRTGGFSPLVMRYFEGLAAGTRLLGVLPRSGEYEAILPKDAFCEVAPDGSDLAERLDEDRSNPNNQRAVDAAGAFVREHHSWRRRAEQVFDRLANGAAIEFPSMQKERPAGRAPSRAGPRQEFAREPKGAIWLMKPALRRAFGDGLHSGR